jgi:capsid protein
VKSVLIATGAGMEFGMSYQGLTRDTSNTTFASGRASGQMDMQGYKSIQKFFSSKTCSPVVRMWMDQAVLSGLIFDEPNARTDYMIRPKFWQRHSWLPGGWSWGINPVQEVNAASSSMKARITSLQDECGNLGLDWKMQLRKQAKAKIYAESLGLKLEEDAPQPVAQAPVDQPQETQVNQ